MDKKTKDKLNEIMLNKQFTNYDKIIQIYISINGKDKAYKLANVLGIPTLFIEEYQVPEDLPKPKMEKSMMTKYINIFTEYHKMIHGRKYDFDPTEIGQLKNCIKKFKDLETFTNILILLEQKNKRIKGKQFTKDKSTWNFIISNMRPSIIYKNRNFILNAEETADKNLDKKQKTKWGWNDHCKVEK